VEQYASALTLWSRIIDQIFRARLRHLLDNNWSRTHVSILADRQSDRNRALSALIQYLKRQVQNRG
jgi:hypothetical protein